MFLRILHRLFKGFYYMHYHNEENSALRLEIDKDIFKQWYIDISIKLFKHHYIIAFYGPSHFERNNPK